MFNNTNIKTVSYGEVLFDIFKDVKKVGGAPLNLAIRLSSFGFQANMISSVGNDENGKELLNFIKDCGVSTDGISIAEGYETGVVQVTINKKGSPTYEIKFPSAWDFIKLNSVGKNMIVDADVFFFGSLVCRNEVSKNSLIGLLSSNQKTFKVFDVNLRKPHYTLHLIKELMKISDFIKLNDEEILEIAPELGSKGKSIEEHMLFLSGKDNLKSVCVTKGKHGAILLWNDKFYYNPGYIVEVVDTVGAGDSFLAALIAKLMSNKNPQEAIDFASAVGAIVASHSGANPKIEYSEINKFLNEGILNH